MSTRANVKIGNTWLYHHHDGYPAWLGVEIAKALPNKTHALTDCATRLVKQIERMEVTDGIHGDIEWLYEISRGSNSEPTLKVSERKPAETEWRLQFSGTLAQFKPYCTKYVEQVNRRIESLNAEHGREWETWPLPEWSAEVAVLAGPGNA